jgi:hypothetical protein
LLDQFKFEIDRAFGRVKKGWQALGLGLKPISGPLGFKGAYVPKPFKTRKFLLPKRALKAGLDPGMFSYSVRGGLYSQLGGGSSTA